MERFDQVTSRFRHVTHTSTRAFDGRADFRKQPNGPRYENWGLGMYKVVALGPDENQQIERRETLES